MPRALHSPSSPPVRLATMPSRHAAIFFMSICAPVTVMPMFSACLICSNISAAEIIALEGMQPRMRHVPPSRLSFSMRTTSLPRSAARNAAAYPPTPPPITTTSAFSVNWPTTIFRLLRDDFAASLATRCRWRDAASTSQAARRDAASNLRQQQRRVLQQPLDVVREPRRVRPVHDAVVERKAQRHELAAAHLAVFALHQPVVRAADA